MQSDHGTQRARVAVHKFSSCDGCQLAFLNLGESLLELSRLVDIVHFAEAGVMDPEAAVDVAFVEGSISTPDERKRIEAVRANSHYLVAIGACATAGGPQALRNVQRSSDWVQRIYASPEYIDSLSAATGIGENVPVDLELWGCPVNSRQVLAAVRALLFGVAPVVDNEKVCMECKRRQNVCVLVAGGQPCMGPVTRTGCGALCPTFGRDCYGCYGPAESPNTDSLGRWLKGLGLKPDAVAQRFMFQNSGAAVFTNAIRQWRGNDDD